MTTSYNSKPIQSDRHYMQNVYSHKQPSHSPYFNKKRQSFSSPQCSTVVQINPTYQSQQSMLQKILFPTPPKYPSPQLPENKNFKKQKYQTERNSYPRNYNFLEKDGRTQKQKQNQKTDLGFKRKYNYLEVNNDLRSSRVGREAQTPYDKLYQDENQRVQKENVREFDHNDGHLLPSFKTDSGQINKQSFNSQRKPNPNSYLLKYQPYHFNALKQIKPDNNNIHITNNFRQSHPDTFEKTHLKIYKPHKKYQSVQLKRTTPSQIQLKYENKPLYNHKQQISYRPSYQNDEKFNQNYDNKPYRKDNCRNNKQNQYTAQFQYQSQNNNHAYTTNKQTKIDEKKLQEIQQKIKNYQIGNHKNLNHKYNQDNKTNKNPSYYHKDPPPNNLTNIKSIGTQQLSRTSIIRNCNNKNNRQALSYDNRINNYHSKMSQNHAINNPNNMCSNPNNISFQPNKQIEIQQKSNSNLPIQLIQYLTTIFNHLITTKPTFKSHPTTPTQLTKQNLILNNLTVQQVKLILSTIFVDIKLKNKTISLKQFVEQASWIVQKDYNKEEDMKRVLGYFKRQVKQFQGQCDIDPIGVSSKNSQNRIYSTTKHYDIYNYPDNKNNQKQIHPLTNNQSHPSKRNPGKLLSKSPYVQILNTQTNDDNKNSQSRGVLNQNNKANQFLGRNALKEISNRDSGKLGNRNYIGEQKNDITKQRQFKNDMGKKLHLKQPRNRNSLQIMIAHQQQKRQSSNHNPNQTLQHDSRSKNSSHNSSSNLLKKRNPLPQKIFTMGYQKSQQDDKDLQRLKILQDRFNQHFNSRNKC